MPRAEQRSGIIPGLDPSRPRLFILLILISCLLPPVLFGMSYLVPNPEHYLTRPGGALPPYFSRDPLGIVLEMSFAGFSRARLLAGEVPFWNPYTGLGHPFVPGTNLSAVGAPLNILRFVLPPDDWSLIFIVNIALAGWFTYLLVRSYGAGVGGGLIAGVSIFAFGTIQVYATVSSIILVYAWLPLALYGVERGLSHGATRFRWVAATAGVYGLLTGGHTTISALCGLTLVLYVAQRLVGSDRRRATRTLLWLSAGALLAAPHWLPFLQYVFDYGNNFEDYSAGTFRLVHLPAWVLPHVYGPINATTSVVSTGATLGLYSSLGWLSPALGFLLVAGVVTLYRERPRGPLALAVAVVPFFLWAFGVPPLTSLTRLPFVARIQPDYLPLVGTICLAVLAGVGYDFLTRQQRGVTAWTAAAWLGIMTLGMVGAVASMHAASASVMSTFAPLGLRAVPSFAWAIVAPALMHSRWGGSVGVSAVIGLSSIAYFPWAWDVPVHRTASLALVVGIGTLAVASVLERMTTRRLLQPAAILAPVILHVVLGMTPNRLPPRHRLYEAPAYARFLQAQEGGWRSYGLGGYLFPNFGALTGIATMNAITDMFPRPSERLAAKYLNQGEKPTFVLGLGHALPDGTKWEPWHEVLKRRRMWDYLGVRYFVDRGHGLVENKAPVSRYERVDSGRDPTDVIAVPLLDPANQTRDLEDTLDCQMGPVDAIAVKFGTYGVPRAGEVELQVRTAGGRAVAIARADAAGIRDNAFTPFLLSKRVCAASAGPLKIRLRYTPRAPVRPLVVWGHSADTRIVFRRLRLRDVTSDGLTAAAVPVPIDSGMVAPFQCPTSPLRAVRVYLGTHRLTHRGVLRVGIADSDGTSRFATTFDSAGIEDVSGIRIPLPPVLCSPGERLRLDVAFAAGSSGPALALFAEPDQPFNYELYTDNGANIVPRFEDAQSGAVVWENLQAQPRAYLAPEARRAPDWEAALDAFGTSPDLRRIAWFDDPDAPMCYSGHQPADSVGSQVTSVTVGVNHVEVGLEAATAGTLVLTDAFMPGWSATVDGIARPVSRVNGVFRGVCIDSRGPHRILFSYFPPNLALGCGFALIGLFLSASFAAGFPSRPVDADPRPSRPRSSPAGLDPSPAVSMSALAQRQSNRPSRNDDVDDAQIEVAGHRAVRIDRKTVGVAARQTAHEDVVATVGELRPERRADVRPRVAQRRLTEKDR